MLRGKIVEAFLCQQAATKLAITFSSFGFKHGPPRDADLLFDVRFLPNPHYEPELRPLTGRDQRIVDFIDRDGKLAEFYALLEPLLDYLFGQYVAEGKSYLLVAIGCTGGRHRSVAIVEHLAARYGARERRARRGRPPRRGQAGPASGDRPRRLRGRGPRALGGLLRRRLPRARRPAAARGLARDRLRDRPRRRCGSSCADVRAAPGYGHVALRGARAGRRRRRPPRRRWPTAAATRGRPGCGRSTGRCTTRRTCATPTACGSSSSAAHADRADSLAPLAVRPLARLGCSCVTAWEGCSDAGTGGDQRLRPDRSQRLPRGAWPPAPTSNGSRSTTSPTRATLAHLLRYDSILGRYPGTVEVDGDATGRRRRRRCGCSPSATRARCRGASSASMS